MLYTSLKYLTFLFLVFPGCQGQKFALKDFGGHAVSSLFSRAYLTFLLCILYTVEKIEAAIMNGIHLMAVCSWS